MFDENILPKKEPTPEKPSLIEVPIFETVEPIPAPGWADGAPPPRGRVETVFDGGGVGVMGGERAENGDAVGAADGAAFATCVLTATGAPAVVFHADVAAPDEADVTADGIAFGAGVGTMGTDVATAVLGTLAPGWRPLGTLVPRPASL